MPCPLLILTRYALRVTHYETMMSELIFTVISGLNVALLGVCSFVILRRKHILNLLLGLGFLSLALLEVGKIAMFLDMQLSERLIGAGLCILPLFWLAFSVSLPRMKNPFSRAAIAPVLGLAILVFFLIWWIRPFIHFEAGGPETLLPSMARYFFMFFILTLSLTLANIERGVPLLRDKKFLWLLVSSAFLLIPYILFATFAVLFSAINVTILTALSPAIFIGAILFLSVFRNKVSFDVVKEEVAVHTSMTLFLAGGYLFFIGVFVKFFQAFGFSVESLFSLFTTLFMAGMLLFVLFSSSLRQRFKGLFLRSFSRQKYDWQKVWEDFTYKISLITQIDDVKGKLKEVITQILDIADVEVFIFDEELPFEKDFGNWLLRKGDVFNFNDAFGNGLAAQYPKAFEFFKEKGIAVATPLYGDKEVIGLIALGNSNGAFDSLDKELFKMLSLQASSVILNCRANQSLRELEKKESIHRVSSFVIHDVKNYINNISLLVANRDKFNNPEFQDDALFTLENTVKKMKRLVEEVKALRGDVASEKKECNIKDIVEEALRDIGDEKLKAVELNKDLDESIFVEADEHSIYKVVLNLLINALEAMSGKGRLHINAKTDGQRVAISIVDNGQGMSKEFVRNSLFKPFTTTKKKGLGIGLYQCKTIVVAHGGSINVESQEGHGTTFTVKFPLATNAEISQLRHAKAGI